jgi:chemotaxis protein MotB
MAQRVRRRDHEEEHENEERWLLTYADMITLLMVLFIVLYSIGQVDLKKFEQLRAGLASSFGNNSAAIEAGSGVLDGGKSPIDGQEAIAQLDAQAAAAAAQKAQLGAAKKEIEDALAGKGLGDKVTFRLEDRGLVLQIVSDEVLFDLGRAELRPEGGAVLDGLVPALQEVPNQLAVEGHTDDSPIRGGPFPTNWELSTARATTVLRYLVEHHGIAANRIAAAGYAETHPVAANDSPTNQARNRRVEVVILAPHTKAAASEATTATAASTGGSTGEH